MLDTIMNAFQKAKRGIIGMFSGTLDTSYEETCFYDLGYMQVRLKAIQKELASVDEQLKNSISTEANTDSVKKHRNELAKQRELLLFHMLFLMSNSFANMDNCKKIAQGHDFKFMDCVNGMIAYQTGDKNKAFDLIDAYFSEYGEVNDHFLINKVFGLLLMNKGDYNRAAKRLSYALQFIPDDMETLSAVRTCYQKNGNFKSERVIAEITSMLET